MRFNGSNNFRESNVMVKNIGKDKVIANFFGRNILKEKKKKWLLVYLFIK